MNHWTETEFLHWLYTGDDSAGHLEVCPECHKRAEAMSQRRRTATRPPEISWEFLAAQRRSIYRRLGSSETAWIPRRLAVALASFLCVVALSLAMIRPWKADNAPLYNSSDAKLFSELVSIDQSEEPKAIEPIRNLFEDQE